MNIPSSITSLLIGILLTIISFWYGQNHGLMPVQASEEAVKIDSLFNLMMTIGTGLFLIVQGILIYSFFKFRRQPGDDSDGPYVEGNIPLEILWTAIPAVIVLAIAVYSFETYNQIGGLNPMDHSVAHAHSSSQMAQMPGAAIAAPLRSSQSSDSQADPAIAPAASATLVAQTNSSPSATQPYVIQAAGLQFAWLFTYPETGVVAGELHVPVGREILLKITANDVLHAFWVPEYRLKQDAVPGQETELRFTPSKAGEYPVICAELCGAYHGVMKTTVIAESPAEFESWMQEQVASRPDDLNQAIATASTAPRTPDQFLAPFVHDFGISGAAIVEQLQPPTGEHTHPAIATAS